MPQKIKSFDVLRTTNEENENGYELLLKELVLQRFFCRGRQILSVYTVGLLLAYVYFHMPK